MNRSVRIVSVFCGVALLCSLDTGTSLAINLTVRRGDVSANQANLSTSGNFVASRQQVLEQRFTMSAPGTLTGIEFAPLLDTADPGDRIFLDVFRSGNLVGTASILAGAFPPGAGNVPAPLDPVATGPGFFSLSHLAIVVSSGEALVFRLRPSFSPGVCSMATHVCTSGRVGLSCTNNLECEKAIRAGDTNNDAYPGGTAIINGNPISSSDLAFKVLLQAASSGNAVTLTWTGGAPDYEVFRSDVPGAVRDAPNQIGSTSGRLRVDVPPSGPLWNYLVVGDPVVDQSNLFSNGNSSVTRQQPVGQSFTIGEDGTLAGIEFAPLRDTADATDHIFLDLYDTSITLLGTASITAAGFPPGTGVPAPLDPVATGPGYFDLSPLAIRVSSGETLFFMLRANFAPGVCNFASHTCTSGRVGAGCFDNGQCEKQFRDGESNDTYPGGTRLRNGGSTSDRDLAFKILLE